MIKANIAKSIKATLLATLVLFSFGAAGEICGSFFETTADAFGTKFPDNKIEDIRTILTELGAPTQRDAAKQAIAVMVLDETPRAIVGWDIASGKQLWKITPPIRSGVIVKNGLFIFQSGFKVAAHDLFTGRQKWDLTIEEGWDFQGADVYGDTAVVAIGVGGKEAGSYSNGRILGLNARTGNKRWDNYSGGGLIGAPQIYKNLVFAPWDRQKIVVLNASDGKEMARLRADDYTINFVNVGPAGAYYGSSPTDTMIASVFKFDEKAASGTRATSTTFTPPLEPVPGDPTFKRDAYAKPVGGRSASEKIRFHWVPVVDQSNEIGISDKAYYLHYWRYIVAFDSNSHRVKWTYRSDLDIESASPVEGGIIGVDSKGKLFFIDVTSGAEIWKQDTGNNVLSAAFDVNGFRPQGTGTPALDPLIGLRELIRDNDNRMLPIRAYAAFLIADFPTPEVTRDLLEVYSDASIPKGLRDSVVQALKKRTTGSEYLVNALHMRYDFLEQTQAPPMGVVSPALVNMNERSAVPGLLSHLMNFETKVEDLREVALAIHELGDASVVGTLKQFLTLYHADSSFLGHEEALSTAADGILKHGGKSGKKFVGNIRDDAQTLPELKSQLLAILDPDAAAKAAAEEAVRVAAENAAVEQSEAESAAHAAAQEVSNRPRSITRDQISEAIANNQSALAPCVQSALGLKPGLRSIRMKFLITGSTGKASKLQLLPGNIPNLQQCLTAGMDTITFPLFQNLRQSATYTIRIAGQVSPGYKYPTQAGSDQSIQNTDPDSFGGGFQQKTPKSKQKKPVKPQPQPKQPAADPDAF